METSKIKVLFICVHNSFRSQMAEGFLRRLGGEDFLVESGGLEVGGVNPLAIDAMKEIGIGIQKQKSKLVFDLYKAGRLYHYVVTVCEKAQASECPVFPGTVERLYWNLDDPSLFEGTYEEKLQVTRRVRDELEEKIVHFIQYARKQNPLEISND